MMSFPWQRWQLLILLLWLATGLRFHRLEVQSFWNDEGNSARLSERSLALIIAGTASDIHPPLYYLLLRGWRELAGATEFGLRALSALAGVVTVAGTAALGRRWGWRTAVAAGGLAALSPPLIYYGQEARMYSLLGTLAVLASLALVRWWERPSRLRLGAYAVCVTAGLYTHYFFPAVLAVHGLLALGWLWRRPDWRRRLSRLALAALAVVLLYLPWLPIFLRQAGGRPSDQQPLLEFLAAGSRWLAFGATLPGAAAAWPLAALAILVGVGLWTGGRRSAAALGGLLVPLGLMIAGGLMKPAFYKFMVVAVPPLCVLAGAGLVASWRRGWLAGWLAALLLATAVLWGDSRSLANLYFDPAYARADYRAMAARIKAANHPDAGIILNAPNQWEVFTYYYPATTAVYPIPRGQPDPDAIAAELSAIADRHDRLYAIFWGEAERDPERLVERWLDAHAFKASDEWVGDVRFVTYAVPSEPATTMATPLNLNFADAITLVGYTLRGTAVRPGEIIELALFWRGERPLATRYKLFLHLAGDDGVPIAQRDSEPGGGLALTTTWIPGELVVDNHGLLVPPGTPPGQYRLRLGLYELSDPAARLPILGLNRPADAYDLAAISVLAEPAPR